MAAVFQSVTLQWKGEDYEITPNMRVINRIEQQFSLSDIAHRVNKGQPPLSIIASVVAILLQEAGAKDVKAEEVYAEMFAGGHDFIMHITGVVLEAAFPVPAVKTGAPVGGGAKVRKQPKSTGAKSTT